MAGGVVRTCTLYLVQPVESALVVSSDIASTGPNDDDGGDKRKGPPRKVFCSANIRCSGDRIRTNTLHAGCALDVYSTGPPIH